jgi:hypothetical protein
VAAADAASRLRLASVACSPASGLSVALHTSDDDAEEERRDVAALEAVIPTLLADPTLISSARLRRDPEYARLRYRMARREAFSAWLQVRF